MKNTTIKIVLIIIATMSMLQAENKASSGTPMKSDQLMSSAQDLQKKAANVQNKAADLLAAQEKRLKVTRVRTDAISKRSEDMLARQETDATRYERIMKTWEKQQVQFQAYLDKINKK